MADPGEFTLRALGNGKINLSQAEAIRDLIDSRTVTAAKQALRQLDGELAITLTPIKEQLLQIIVLLESSLEFAEEDLPQLKLEQITDQLKSIGSSLGKLASTYSAGHLLAEGIRVAIVGRPNVGKSSLFNQLVGLDRAIVTEIPGTTRDSIGEQITVDGFPIVLVDTAGMRESDDRIEAIGIERTRSAIADADLVLVVLDGSEPLQAEDREVLAVVGGVNHLVLLNKCDVASFSKARLKDMDHVPTLAVSALTGVGIDRLRTAMLEPFRSLDKSGGDLLITNARHYDLLTRAGSEVSISVERMGLVGEELVLVGLHNALRLLDEITGETTPEDILARIFSTFCIGK
jgi:tRNA modification GTPase